MVHTLFQHFINKAETPRLELGIRASKARVLPITLCLKYLTPIVEQIPGSIDPFPSFPRSPRMHQIVLIKTPIKQNRPPVIPKQINNIVKRYIRVCHKFFVCYTKYRPHIIPLDLTSVHKLISPQFQFFHHLRSCPSHLSGFLCLYLKTNDL